MYKYFLGPLIRLCFFSISLVCFLQKGKGQTPALKLYEKEVNDWHQKRAMDLKQPEGWLNLEGLFWLHKGINTLGTALGSDCRYQNPRVNSPRFPNYIGDFIYEGDSVVWVNKEGYSVLINNEIVEGNRKTVFSATSQSSVMTWSHYSWTIIKREEKIGVRFRNLKSLNVTNFKTIPRFPTLSKWKIKAILHPPVQSLLMIMNVLGQNTATKNAGKLEFTYAGKQYTLDVIDEGGPLYFITFADLTSDKTTYGAGRFIELPKPDANGNTEIDFNKAYNPPCAFNSFATCPLPPPQNRLNLLINAGEKKYGHH